MKNAKKWVFNYFFKGLHVFFLHKLQRGQKQQNVSLLQLMALVVYVTATATDTNCVTVPVAVALKKPLIATKTNWVAPDTVAVAAAQFWR